MRVTEARVTPLREPKGGTVAYARITIDEAFVVRDLRVVEGKKGLFVAMPQRKGKGDEYQDIAFPITREAREAIQEAVLAAYESPDGKWVNDEDDGWGF
ncbi:MAG TPA: SpoVG family protein [Trueperaceae bacterium]